MAATPIHDLSRCAIHTFTNKPWSLRQCIDAYAARGIGGISVWRNVIDPTVGGVAPAEAGRWLEASGLSVPALVRGGFFPGSDSTRRSAAMEDNRICIDEAQAIGADMVVLVVGAVPGMPLAEARRQVVDGIAGVLPHAEGAGIKLAIEPLHPMYAGDKSCINRMAEARWVCEQLQHPLVGIALDVYHVWWDPDLHKQIDLAGERRLLFGFHICDWRLPTRHLLTDRGLMGDGCIDIPTIRNQVETASGGGFDGFHEIEVFSEDYWAMDQHAYLDAIVHAYRWHT